MRRLTYHLYTRQLTPGGYGESDPVLTYCASVRDIVTGKEISIPRRPDGCYGALAKRHYLMHNVSAGHDKNAMDDLRLAHLGRALLMCLR